MVIVPLIQSVKVDPSKAVDIIIESELNHRIFKGLLNFYQEEKKKDAVEPPEGLRPDEYPRDLTVEKYFEYYRDLNEATVRRMVKYIERGVHGPDEITLREIGELAGEPDLGILKKSLRLFENVYLITKVTDDIYSYPVYGAFFIEDYRKLFGFDEYLDIIQERIKLFSQVAKYLGLEK